MKATITKKDGFIEGYLFDDKLGKEISFGGDVFEGVITNLTYVEENEEGGSTTHIANDYTDDWNSAVISSLEEFDGLSGASIEFDENASLSYYNI